MVFAELPLVNSLVSGFLGSNAMGKAIVLAQLFGSVIMVAAILGKSREFGFIRRKTRQFLRDFTSGGDVLDYYIQRRPAIVSGIEKIYKDTCERLFKLLSPNTASLIAGRGAETAALTSREIELVKGTCEHVLDEEELQVENGMGIIATVVALEPMLGLLGTVWGVLDAFADMGSTGSANLATIAPSISAALVTTVVGLLVAIPGVACYNKMNATMRDIMSDMEGFSDELMGRIACEFQGR